MSLSPEIIILLMFSTLMLLMLTGQRVFAAMGFVGVTAALFLFFSGLTSLVESSALGALASFVVALLRRRLTWPIFKKILRETLDNSAMFMWIMMAALAFAAVFDGLGAVRALEGLFMNDLGLSPWQILLMMQISFIILGIFLDDTAMLVIVALP